MQSGILKIQLLFLSMAGLFHPALMKPAISLEILQTVSRGVFVPETLSTQLAESPNFDSVGMLQISGGLGSGTLIGPQWVITAAHVISNSGGRHNLSSATFSLKGNLYTADYAEVLPSWSGNSGQGNDLALVHLTSPVSAVAASEFRIQTSDLTNAYVTFVGFGLGGDGQSGFIPGTGGVKRAGTNFLDYNGTILGLNSSIYLADFDSGLDSNNVLGSAAPTDFESILTPGDSGGGVFMLYNGQTILVGVNSFMASTTGSADGRYGNLGGFQAIGPQLAWVQSITQVPEPASIVLGVVCALIGWWAIEKQAGRQSKQQLPLATTTKPKRIS
jgi:hypothetical protein